MRLSPVPDEILARYLTAKNNQTNVECSKKSKEFRGTGMSTDEFVQWYLDVEFQQYFMDEIKRIHSYEILIDNEIKISPNMKWGSLQRWMPH